MPYYGNLYSGSTAYRIPMSDDYYNLMDEFIDDLVEQNKQDCIVSLVACPSDFGESFDHVASYTDTVDIPSTIGGYTPYNKKLLTYPYCFITVDCLNDYKDFRYELFKSSANKIGFQLDGYMSPIPEISIAPCNYNGFPNANVTEQIIMKGFPQLACSIDSYKAFVAQGGIDTFNTSLIRGIAEGMIGSTIGGPVGGLITVGASSTIRSAYTSAKASATKGNTSRGSVGVNINVSNRTKNVYYKYMGVTEETARIIDDFFSRYGYACNKVKIPNRNVRPHWTYTKTVDCSIKGDMPVEAIKKICEIYDKGITFWKNGDIIGQYGLNNSPVQD